MKCYNRVNGLKFSLKEIEETAKSGYLLTLEIEFNRDCNFNCTYCYQADLSSNRAELTKEEFCNAIVQAKGLGARTIIILGGEPMLYPYIMEMLQFIKNLGLNTEIFTNGLNINSSTATMLYGYETTVVLKMNTFNESLQDILSGKKGAYKQIQTAFNSLKEAGYPDKEHHFCVSTVICKQNIDELPYMWKWLREQNISPYFEMITPQGKAKTTHCLFVDIEEVRKLFYELAEIDKEFYGLSWEPQPPLVGMNCLRHLYSCAVSSTGNVSPCVGVTISTGNIREKSLKEIIRDSKVIKELRHYKNHIKGPCRECEKVDTCYGCRGSAFQLTGDYLASDPLCWISRERRQ